MKEPLNTDPAIEEAEGKRFVNESGEELQQKRMQMIAYSHRHEHAFVNGICTDKLCTARRYSNGSVVYANNVV